MKTNYKEMLKTLSKNTEAKDANDRVMIVDGLNMFIRVFGAVPTLNDDGEHVGGVTGFLLSLGARVREFNPTRVVIAFDGKGGSSTRKKMYSNYKSQRNGLTKLNRLAGFEDLEDQERSMKNQFLMLIKYLQLLPVDICYLDYVEADDVMAYAAVHLFKKQVQIISSDRDFLQLINDRISVYLPTKKKLIGKSNASEVFGVLAENIVFYRIIDGDTSDNIQGIRGIGPKTIHSKLKFLSEEPVGELSDFLERIENLDDEKFKTKLLDNKDILELNYNLMQLTDPPIGVALKSKVRSIIQSPVNRLNVFLFKKEFMIDKLYTAFKNVEYWIGNTWTDLDKYAKTTHK
jgi:DNA polymerase-1